MCFFGTPNPSPRKQDHNCHSSKLLPHLLQHPSIFSFHMLSVLSVSWLVGISGRGPQGQGQEIKGPVGGEEDWTQELGFILAIPLSLGALCPISMSKWELPVSASHLPSPFSAGISGTWGSSSLSSSQHPLCGGLKTKMDRWYRQRNHHKVAEWYTRRQPGVLTFNPNHFSH